MLYFLARATIVTATYYREIITTNYNVVTWLMRGGSLVMSGVLGLTLKCYLFAHTFAFILPGL